MRLDYSIFSTLLLLGLTVWISLPLHAQEYWLSADELEAAYLAFDETSEDVYSAPEIKAIFHTPTQIGIINRSAYLFVKNRDGSGEIHCHRLPMDGALENVLIDHSSEEEPVLYYTSKGSLKKATWTGEELLVLDLITDLATDIDLRMSLHHASQQIAVYNIDGMVQLFSLAFNQPIGDPWQLKSGIQQLCLIGPRRFLYKLSSSSKLFLVDGSLSTSTEELAIDLGAIEQLSWLEKEQRVLVADYEWAYAFELEELALDTLFPLAEAGIVGQSAGLREIPFQAKVGLGLYDLQQEKLSEEYRLAKIATIPLPSTAEESQEVKPQLQLSLIDPSDWALKSETTLAGNFQDAAIHQNKNQIAVATSDNTLSLFQVKKDTIQLNHQDHSCSPGQNHYLGKGAISSMRFHPQKSTLWYTGTHPNVTLSEWEYQRTIRKCYDKLRVVGGISQPGHVLFAENEAALIFSVTSKSEETSLRLYPLDAKSKSYKKIIKQHQGGAMQFSFYKRKSKLLQLAISPNGQYLLSAWADGKIELFDLFDNRLIQSWAKQTQTLIYLDFTASNQALALRQNGQLSSLDLKQKKWHDSALPLTKESVVLQGAFLGAEAQLFCHTKQEIFLIDYLQTKPLGSTKIDHPIGKLFYYPTLDRLLCIGEKNAPAILPPTNPNTEEEVAVDEWPTSILSSTDGTSVFIGTNLGNVINVNRR